MGVGEAAPRDRLLALLRRDAVLHGDFVLASGRRSTLYLDARRVTLSAAGSALVGQVFLEMLKDQQISAVAGPSIAADPIVSAIAVMSGLTGRSIDGIIIRKQAKEHGTGGRMVGPWKAGATIAVVDDTFTSGGSVLDACQAVTEEGGYIAGVFGLIDREQGARQALESAGYLFECAFTAKEILEA